MFVLDLELNPVGKFTLDQDSINFNSEKVINFNKYHYFKHFKGCYVRVLNANDHSEFKSDHLIKEDSKVTYTLKTFEEHYLDGNPYPPNRLDHDLVMASIEIPNGRWIKLDKNGDKVFEFDVVNHTIDGFVYLYHSNNVPKRIVQFSNGYFLNYTIDFFPNGQIREFSNNTRADIYCDYVFVDKGRITELSIPNAFLASYNLSGLAIKYVEQKKYKWEGNYIIRNDYGVIILRGTYFNDRQNGIFKYYDDSGKFLKFEFYISGIKII